ncbi:MAG TPA: hypothetical protein VGK67_06795 [Myxococcales bacterium]|jgi:hypothetical protein
MLDQIEARTGERPAEVPLDGGYVKLKDIEDVQGTGTKVYAPEPEHRNGSTGGVPRKGDSRAGRRAAAKADGHARRQGRPSRSAAKRPSWVNAQFKETSA